MIQTPKTEKLLLTLAIFTILFILSLSVNAFYFEDDYVFMVDLQQNGLLKNCTIMYNTWDGRFFTLGAFAQGFCLLYFPIGWITFFWSICFLTSGFLIYYIIKLETNLPEMSKTKTYFVMLILPISFWLGSFFHLYQTVYWGTGGIYSFDLFIGAIWVYLFLKLQKTKLNLTQKTGFFIFSILASAGTENLSIALITLSLITLFINYFESKKGKTAFNFLILFGLIFGLLFIALAPGNFVRLGFLNNASKPFGFFYFIKSFCFIFIKYLIASSALCFLSFLLSIALIAVNNKVIFKLQLPNFKSKQDKIELLKNSKWFLVALSTITPFITIPEVVSKRTSIYFLFFMMIFVLIITIKIINYCSENTKKIVVINNKSICNRIFGLILALSLVVILYNFNIGVQLKKAVTERENMLKNSKNKTAYIKLINPKLRSNCFRFKDFYVNGLKSESYIIDSQERYFQTKIVVIK